jgi:hypothetical protein
MPVGLVRKWTVMAILAGAIGLVACKDDGDDTEPLPDSGSMGGGTGGGTGGDTGGGMDSGTDGGGGTGGGNDAGRDSGPAPNYGEAGPPCTATNHASGMAWDGGPVMCGDKTCYWHNTALTCSNPGCLSVNDASVCAIDTTTLGGVDAGLPPLLPYNAPGVDSPACAELVDSFEDSGVGDGGTRGNGLIDTVRMIRTFSVSLRYPGCCTPQGFCSGNTSKGEGMLQGTNMYNPSSAGYGCLNNRIFFATNPAAQNIYCDPATGALIDGGAGYGNTGDSGAGEGGAGEGGAGEGGSGDGG